MTPSEPDGAERRRRLHWLAFWVVFLTTPMAFLILPLADKHLRMVKYYNVAFGVGGAVVAGAFVSAYLLARIRSTTTVQIVRRTILLGIAFLLFYGALGFAGCLVVVSKSQW